MSSHKLRFESRAADGSIGLSLMRDQNIVGQDKVQAGDFGDLDEICKKLNNDQNRSIAADMGADLFDRIFVTGGTLRNYWDSLDDDTRGLPLELVIEDAELAAYPWELLRDADDNMPAQLGGMIRRSQVPALPRDLAEWPLRFLVILGTLDAKINGKVEFDNLRRDLLEVGRSVDVCCVELPSSDEVRKVLKEYQPHVIHFIGHSEEGGLWIANKTNAWAWKTAVIKADMKNADCAPLLVFLNSCRSAVEPSKAVTRRASASVQAAFARRAACVIAMQADVQGERAMKFSRAFYRLALKPNGDPPDFMPIAEAVREARRALTDDDQELDWALPTLTFNTSEMDFSTRLGRRPKYARVLTCGEFEDTKLFANCEQERRELVQWHCWPKASARNILILRGPASSGRSHLLKWCMESWAAAGDVRVRYFSTKGLPIINCLKLLICLRKGEVSVNKAEEDRLLHGPLDLDPFRPFYSSIAKSMGTSGTVDKDEEIRQIDSFEQELYANQDLKIVAAKFLEGLKNMGQKVILVLDELNNFKEDELFKEFVEYILKPVAIDRESNVRIVIAVDDQKYNSWKLSDLKPESVCEVMLSTDQNDDQLIALAAEAFRLPRRAELDPARKTAKSEEDLLEAAKLLFRLNQPAGKGLGRLQILKTIEEICKCDRPKRMR